MIAIPTAVVVLLLAQVQPATPSDPANEPPAGSAEDRALWRDLRDAANAGTLAMGRVNQLGFRIQYGRSYESLDALAAGGDAGLRAEASALRGRLEEAARAAKDAIPEGGPGIRDCQYVNLDLATHMSLASDPKAATALAGARRDAKACLERLRPFARTMTARADALEAAVDAVDALVQRAGPLPAPAAPAPAGAAKP